MSNFVKLTNVSKTFEEQKKVNVLKKISYNFKKGKIYSLMGPSGSGKSTLLNLLSLIDRPNSGSISFENEIINYNDMSKNDLIRANKIGIPAGVFSDKPLPDRVEAYYGKSYSKILALEATDAVNYFFNGNYSNDKESKGLSIKDYLDYLEADKEEKLSEKINSQLEKIKTKVSELNTNFSEQVNQENLKMLIAYDVIQANVVFLKVDMLQVLNISVDYVDADGD